MTWRELRERINAMGDAELDGEAQVAAGTIQALMPLLPIVACDTLDALEMDCTRSSYDNDHHGRDVVLLTDAHPYGLDGVAAHDLLTGEPLPPPRGVKSWLDHPAAESGKVCPRCGRVHRCGRKTSNS